MPKPLIVLSGTRAKEFRVWAPSATEALRLVRNLMKLRRPGVTVEDEHGNPVSFFQLKEMAELENHEIRGKTGGFEPPAKVTSEGR